MANPMGVHGQPHGLPKLDTHLGSFMNSGPRTANLPVFGSDDVELEKFFGPGSAVTIDPNQLHRFAQPMQSATSPFTAFSNPFSPGNPSDEPFSWGPDFDNNAMFPAGNETAIDGSSPSAISTASQSGFEDVMQQTLDGAGQPVSSAIWNPPLVSHAGVNPAFSLETMAPVFPELSLMDTNPMPGAEMGDTGMPTDFYSMSSPQAMPSMSPSAGIPGMPNQYFHPVMGFQSDSNSISSQSMNGSARQSSVTSVSTETITDATRQALVVNLTQALGFAPAQRKYSQPQISSPLSTGVNGKLPNQIAALPSTADLQRYVNAYIQYFHPHMPFLHIPTLSFDTPPYTHQIRTPTGYSQDSMVGGGGCLILAMAAIGALYEYDRATAKELFEAGRKLILWYLDERRRAGMSAAVNGANSANDAINKPPLWLVQAMLLHLIYGHNCGDRQAAEVASTHCAALVSLAKAAGLDKPSPPQQETFGSGPAAQSGDIEMSDDISAAEFLEKTTLSDQNNDHAQWLQWKATEERKRTYFAVFSMSSLLVSAYAHAPRILNSEIRLDLPCEEDLWAADNAQAWAALGGPTISQSPGLSFNRAMTYLLEASMRQHRPEAHAHSTYSHFGEGRGSSEVFDSEIHPSTFGCYVLINALHVYIWETRQRHSGRLWKLQETEAMHAQVEPALKAWQAAWRANPRNKLQRPNPYGPLATDCIPLLDLAYIRLFVNLVRSKELLWQRDFDGMATELARGIDVVPQSEGSPDRSKDPTESLNLSGNHAAVMTSQNMNPSVGINMGGAAELQSLQSSKRERHLRKAACYAADSLAMSEELGTSYTARDLPNSAAMCSFDCAQVLSEWVACVQDRVGRFLGILGKDNIDYSAVPAIMLLEEEDVKLLQKIDGILQNADMKLAMDLQSMGSSSLGLLDGLTQLRESGYGTKLLMVTAYMLSRVAVWPGKSL